MLFNEKMLIITRLGASNNLYFLLDKHYFRAIAMSVVKAFFSFKTSVAIGLAFESLRKVFFQSV